MKNWIIQIIVILVISAIIGISINEIRSEGIALIGNWPSRTAEGDEPVIPPSAQLGDPPFITLDDAVTMYQSSRVTFIDARDPVDYEYGHIGRAINIPFDYLDEEWDKVIAELDRTDQYVIYCGGTECESSLQMGRYFYELGFENVFVFYGGWHEWTINNMPFVGQVDEEEY